jgi:hypothetical protein
MSGSVTLDGDHYTATVIAQEACVGQTLYLTSYITPVITTLSFPQYFFQQSNVVLHLGENTLRVDAPDCPAPGSQADLATIPGANPVLEFDIYSPSTLLAFAYDHNTCGANACTLGYWKNHQPWPGGYTTDTLVASVFSGPGIPAGYTFQQALTYAGSNKAQLLFKQAVAAVLNIAGGSTVNYPLTLSELVTQVNAALSASDQAKIALQTTLDTDNNMGRCPFN